MGRGLLITAILALGLGFVSSAPASAGTPEIFSHFYDPGTEIVPSPITCDPGGSAIHGEATFGTEAGDDWVGVTTYDYCVYPQAEAGWFSFTGTETLAGTVRQCGPRPGTMTWSQTGTFHAGTTDGGGNWRVISATDGLGPARGAGTSTTFVTDTLENYGYFSGWFHC
ncbi:hypothetical protein [Kutzneria sp. NPDC052558]|uniref:hypothetical protein n=1 Tax=Kutzneria sp. NPDC052558 TaxID=3364121 RepID=UPI0037CAFFD4